MPKRLTVYGVQNIDGLQNNDSWGNRRNGGRKEEGGCKEVDQEGMLGEQTLEKRCGRGGFSGK